MKTENKKGLSYTCGHCFKTFGGPPANSVPLWNSSGTKIDGEIELCEKDKDGFKAEHAKDPLTKEEIISLEKLAAHIRMIKERESLIEELARELEDTHRYHIAREHGYADEGHGGIDEIDIETAMRVHRRQRVGRGCAYCRLINRAKKIKDVVEEGRP